LDVVGGARQLGSLFTFYYKATGGYTECNWVKSALPIGAAMILKQHAISKKPKPEELLTPPSSKAATKSTKAKPGS